eukprot:gnl/MRDRNA2_/MRDRNA2_96476_c0_seq1.p1 gnl/MRDRNA2_/MRDRNA2_96476_c0~~gnl/MRDRNA2_/MRDRNA2_96476_c0_seq1.p1  ORF type:complete len:567 (-),score=99.30 gnl/MRDRNA2_/MRDRNA2_96476_c0_seq1:8-1708(-)
MWKSIGQVTRPRAVLPIVKVVFAINRVPRGKFTCHNPRFVTRLRYHRFEDRRFVSGDALPAHLSYSFDNVTDAATLRLMVQSARASKYDIENFWNQCQTATRRLHAKGCSSRELLQIWKGLADVNFCDAELMYNLGGALEAEIPVLTADDIAIALQIHAVVKISNGRLLTQLTEAMLLRMRSSRSTPGSIATSLLSLVQLQEMGFVTVPEELLGGAARMATEHREAFSVEEMGFIMEAYGSLEKRGERQISLLFSGIATSLSAEASALSAGTCATAARAFAKCRVHDERLINTLATRLREKEVRDALTPSCLVDIIYCLGKFSCQDVALLDILTIEVRKRLPAFESADIAQALASFAKAGVKNPVLISRVAAHLKRLGPKGFDELTAQELSTLAMAFGKLQVRDKVLFEAIGDALIRQAEALEKMKHLSNLVNVFQAFAKVHHIHERLFRLLSDVMHGRFEELGPDDHVRMMHALGKMEYADAELALRLVSALQKDQGMSKLKLFDVLKVSNAAVRLGVVNDKLEQHLARILPKELRTGDNSLYSQRRQAPLKRKRASARKQRWTW